MKPLNTFPIEDFLEKARIARKSNQKSLTLTPKEFTDLADTLAMVMTRLSGSDDNNSLDSAITIKMDGGRF